LGYQLPEIKPNLVQGSKILLLREELVASIIIVKRYHFSVLSEAVSGDGSFIDFTGRIITIYTAMVASH